MPITDQFIRLPLDSISVPRDSRQRREVETKGLVDSIRLQGVLQPIIIHKELGPDGKHELVAGERRLASCRELNLPDIPCRFAEDLSSTEAQIIELEENIKRSDLLWQDTVRATERIHNLFRTLDPEWTQQETADAISLTQSTIALYLAVAREIDINERVQGAGTVREAYNLLKRRDARLAGEALNEILEIGDYVAPEIPAGTSQGEGPGVALLSQPQSGLQSVPSTLAPGSAGRPLSFLDPAKTIFCESFLHWAPKYQGKKFNFLHCDFPYGVELFSANGLTSGPQRSQMGQGAPGVYSDSKDLYFGLLECLLTNLDKLMSVSGHMMFWYSAQHLDETKRLFRELAPSLSIHRFPLIWHKTDNFGIASDVRQGPRHVYETCLLITRGNRQIVRVVSDVYGCQTDKRFHVSTKPEPMLKHFMAMLVDENTSILDPTCGSASSIRAAEDLGARVSLGLDIDEQTVGMARQALRQFRALRGASRQLGALT